VVQESIETGESETHGFWARKKKRGVFMKKQTEMSRSLFLVVSTLLLVAGGWTDGFGQEKFPAHPIQLIVATPPGGGNDITSRMIADEVAPLLGQKVVIVNKPGASQTLGAHETAKAKPDGYTILTLSNAPLTLAHFVLKIPYTLDDFSYVTLLNKGVMAIAVLSESPFKTAEELFEFGRKNPQKLTYGGDGIGNNAQFAAEKVFQGKGAKFRFVPYNGTGDVLKAALGGHVDIYSGSLMPLIPHIKAGKVRPLFVSSKERNKLLPDVPGTDDLGLPNASMYLWRGVFGPKGISADRLAILQKTLQQATQSEKAKAFYAEQGDEPGTISGKEMEAMIRAEAAANAVVAKQIGLSQ
jgi:tripartite-type tricarboxylate transporter receptor subunit TctC